MKFLVVPGAIQHCEESFLEVPWKGQIARVVPNVGASSTPTEVTPTNVSRGGGGEDSGGLWRRRLRLLCSMLDRSIVRWVG